MYQRTPWLLLAVEVVLPLVPCSALSLGTGAAQKDVCSWPKGEFHVGSLRWFVLLKPEVSSRGCSFD